MAALWAFIVAFLFWNVEARPATFLQDFRITWSESHIRQLEGGKAIQLPYTVQTNVFVHGKGNREQRINLWFDPAVEFHTYTILWNHHHTVFYIDEVPIRVYKNNEARGIPFPKLQAMGVYSTLWEADDWATRGGLEKIDWAKAPFYAYYKDFDIEGCPVPGPAGCASSGANWWEGAAYAQLSPVEARMYRWVRTNHMIYDYCTDRSRSPVPAPECAAGI
ncbi:xyloglucan endotransglucosylase/hydrolase [Striga asiatica]|uniref:Xyloglucan endotransglucosylase/hydrolase n=1 Tax=Striga asiatica TaxID=4170 RepID=A0A5A7Q457_STRAF|nr:xyloglucan endotransglucosylase/hydrolase [Striga asiatica]